VETWTDILPALAAKVPELVIFLILTTVFMRAQKALANSFTDYMKQKDSLVDEVIDTNSDVIRENTKVLAVALHVMEGDDG
jgi:1,4-dihydroxy-2-naphthoate octaprenyltransferase